MNFAGGLFNMNPVDVTKAFRLGNAFDGSIDQQNYILPNGSTSSLTAQLPPKQNPFEPKKGSTIDDALSQLILAKLDPANQQRELENASVFQERQMRKALPYNLLSKGLDTLSKLPEQISTNAASRAMLNVIGAESAARAFNQTMASYPKTNFQSTIPLVQRNYFT